MIFGLIPGLIIWLETANAAQWLKAALAATLVIYLIIGFHALDPFFKVYPALMTVGYFMVSMFWLGLCGFILFTKIPQSNPKLVNISM